MIGTVAEIWRYPVKSMGGEQLDGEIRVPNGKTAVTGDTSANDKLSDFSGRKVTRVPSQLRMGASRISKTV